MLQHCGKGLDLDLALQRWPRKSRAKQVAEKLLFCIRARLQSCRKPLNICWALAPARFFWVAFACGFAAGLGSYLSASSPFSLKTEGARKTHCAYPRHRFRSTTTRMRVPLSMKIHGDMRRHGLPRWCRRYRHGAKHTQPVDTSKESCRVQVRNPQMTHSTDTPAKRTIL
jgi:hypothetical protein